MAPGGEPLSIESLLQKQKEEREAAARVDDLCYTLSSSYLSPFSPSSSQRKNVRRLPLRSEPKKYNKRKKGKRRTGRTGNNSSARLRLFDGKRETASIRRAVAHGVRPSSLSMSHVNSLIVIAQMMTTTIAAARGVTAAEDMVEEITVTGVQMMIDVQGIAMYRLDPVQSGLKLLLTPPRHHREVPSPFRHPTRQLLVPMPHSLLQ